MKHKERVLALVMVAMMIIAVKLGQQLWRWVAFDEERRVVSALEVELKGEGIAVIRTQIMVDSLRSAIQRLDDELNEMREQLDRVERRVNTAGIPPAREQQYRARVTDYNQRVRRRNELYQEWEDLVTRNHLHVDRFNLLVDSIQSLATRMGEPYYPIDTPAEIANRRGLTVPE